jgi:hypothetical protein
MQRPPNNPFQIMNPQKYLWLLTGVVIVTLFLTVSSIAWIPDLIGERTIVLDRWEGTGGDKLQLTQKYVGDGYSTRFTHTNAFGRAWLFAIAGDAEKAWKGSLEKTSNIVKISILKEVFFYDIESHAIRDSKGISQLILELPEDGSPASFSK